MRNRIKWLHSGSEIWLQERLFAVRLFDRRSLNVDVECKRLNCYDCAVASLLEIRNLTISFPVRNGASFMDVAAVRDINFSIGRGKVLGLVGVSGSGKSVTSL